jgi:hypothetical protein
MWILATRQSGKSLISVRGGTLKKKRERRTSKKKKKELKKRSSKHQDLAENFSLHRVHQIIGVEAFFVVVVEVAAAAVTRLKQRTHSRGNHAQI